MEMHRQGRIRQNYEDLEKVQFIGNSEKEGDMEVANQEIFHKNPEAYSKRNEVPLKNPFCPYYSECLDRAVEEKLPQFTCYNCEFRNRRIGVMPDSRELRGYYHLLEKVFLVN